MAASRTPPRPLLLAACAATVLAALGLAAEARKAAGDPVPTPIPLAVPEGFEIELVAGPPLVNYPIAASFDDRGRLYVAESSGEQLPTAEMAKRQSHVIKVLEDTDGDGKFDKVRVFADRLTFPEGVLWHDGAVYTASPPFVWKFEDTRGAGVADKRLEWQKGFQIGHCANEGHGPYIGPDGRIYWGKGGFTEHHLRGAKGKELHGRSSHVFRCRPDGSELEAVMSGGMDNPVGVTFTPEGELIFSCTFYTNPNQGMRDALVHAVEGGAYPKLTNVLDGVKRTGELLPALAHLGPAAVAGITTTQSSGLGEGYLGNVFSAQFNMHKVGRHILRRAGASFESKNEDFVTSSSVDFHPTDVVEDADGSLLVVNTGGWYLICCPTSVIAKPQVKGGIYRVRKKGAARPDDPRGLALPWDTMTPAALAGLLDDPRFAVRNRAVHQLGKHAADAVEILAKALREGRTTLARRNAVWALTRIEGDAARAAVRGVLEDRDASVRQTAIYSTGLHRDADARQVLAEMLASVPPSIRRETATALGRIGHPAAVPALLAALRPEDDRMLEHALIYALIEIADRPALTRALQGDNPVVRRAALIALDQADDGSLEPRKVTPLLKDPDARVQAAALEALEHHPSWAREVLGVVRDWFGMGNLPPGGDDEARRLLAAYSGEGGVQAFVVETLHSEKTPAPARRLLLEVMAQAPLRPWPNTWREGLTHCLADADESVLRQAAATLRAVTEARSPACTAPLLRLAGDAKRPADLRVAALAAAAPQVERLEPALFDFLLSCLDTAQPPLLRATAAEAIGQLRPSDEQLSRLCGVVATAGPLELPRLLAAFEQGGSAALGKSLVTALEKSSAARGLRAEVLTRTLEKFPAEVRKAAEPLLARLAEDVGKQKARLDELSAAASGGDHQRGRQVFLGAKATCAACHSVAGQGGLVGPDLTKIGATRSERDLLEAIIFPSASFVRGYEPYVITTRNGQTYSGVIRRETADALVVATGPATEVRILRSAIEEIDPGKVSVMPEGLDRQLSHQELADLIAYLRTLR
jgi:putative membrane-bound dehydrogenase-like protein